MRSVLLPNIDPRDPQRLQNRIRANPLSGAMTSQVAPRNPGSWLTRDLTGGNSALSTGLIQGGLSMLANNGPGGGSFSQALAQGLGSGLNAYNSVKAGQEQETQRMGMAGALQRMVEQMDLPPEKKAVLMRLAATGDLARVQDLAAAWIPQEEAYTLGQGEQRYENGQMVAENVAPERPEYDANFSAAMSALGLDPQSVRVFELPEDVRREVFNLASEFRRSGATNVTQSNPAQGKFQEALGTNIATTIQTGFERAQDALTAITAIEEAQQIADSEEPMYTGAFGNMALAAGKVFGALGYGDGSAVENTETYQSLVRSVVLPKVKALGSGQGISDADRRFVEQMVAGDITVDRTSMRRILEIQMKIERAAINNYNSTLERARGVSDSPELGFYQPIQMSEGYRGRFGWMQGG